MHFICKKCKKHLELSERNCIFATQLRVCENPNLLLVKSSLVFVLVVGCRLVAHKFYKKSVVIRPHRLSLEQTDNHGCRATH